MADVVKSGIGKSLSKIVQTERQLAELDDENVIEMFPEGHPMRDEITKLKEQLGSLANIPHGHPVRIAIRKQSAANKIAALRERRKSREDKNQRNVESKDSTKSMEKFRASVQRINKQAEIAAQEFRRLAQMLDEDNNILMTNRFAYAKGRRLSRTAQASCRMIEESHISKV